MPGDLAPFLHQLLLAAQQLAATSRARADMTTTEYTALHHLTHHRGGLTPSQLGSRLAITSGSVTQVIDRLEHRRLARRVRQPTGDRRSITIIATPTGTNLITQDLQTLLTHIPTTTPTPLTHDQRDIVARLLHILDTNPTTPTSKRHLPTAAPNPNPHTP
jgi:MarR family transcriptional regulator, organic hydroperoxide resistance regulator